VLLRPYAGTLREWSHEQLGIDLEVVYPCWRQRKRNVADLLEPLGYRVDFHVLPRRWVVERSIAWLSH
jgi:putative transposase